MSLPSAAPLLNNNTFSHWLKQLPLNTDLHFTELHPALAAAFVASQHHNTSGVTLFLAENSRPLLPIQRDISAWLPDALIFQPQEIHNEELLAGLQMCDEENNWLSLLSQLQKRSQYPVKEPLIIFGATTILRQKLPSSQSLAAAKFSLQKNHKYNLAQLTSQLDEAGYLRVPQVDAPGQYAPRGGILDIFSTDSQHPVRIEWDGDLIEGLWQFDPAHQRRTRPLHATTIQLGKWEEQLTSTLRDHLPVGCRLVFIGRAENALPTPLIADNTFSPLASRDLIGYENRTRLLFSTLDSWLQNNWTIHIAAQNTGERDRLQEILASHNPLWPHRITLHILPITRGFTLPDEKFSLLTDAEIFCRSTTANTGTRNSRRSILERRTAGISTSDELLEGDLVVHIQHGIGRYMGIHPVNLGGAADEEVIVLEYADAAKLYVPLAQAHLISRYVGAGKTRPALDSLGGRRWERAKKSAQRAIFDYAAKLLAIQAGREVHHGHAFAPDTHWQREFEDAFPYTPTPDQLAAIDAVKKDMESPRPMDRLICGDVGFGKTEVAIRAAFKAVMDGRQVAFLCPTSVLARQHFITLSQRMSDYPVKVRMLTRFQDAPTTRQILEKLATGACDIVVGTHRLLSPDVVFSRIGLLIVDEEQRFGVRDKEKLKERFPRVDILTLSATPIPRTLYLALMGARDLSTIETPPPGRVPVDTHVLAYDERLIRQAIIREIDRGGQVFFLHNRIASIEKICARLRELVPGLRVLAAHGRMHKDDLENTMAAFVDGQADVLVTTTIIESGIDMPNVNTILIDRADRFGLADLYQLRGRVGRAQCQAHAYLFFPPHIMARGDARRRAAAIKQYRELGSGFKIALRDLEIRGAGNLLGLEQSGHLAAIGFDLYCRLLKESVSQLKSGKISLNREVSLSLDFVTYSPAAAAAPGKLAAFIPQNYLDDARLRIAAYRELAELSSVAEWRELRDRWADVFGKFPAELQHLLAVHLVRCTALDHGLTSVECRDGKIFLRRGEKLLLNADKLPRLTSEDPTDWPLEIVDWIKRLTSKQAPSSGMTPTPATV